MLAQIIEVIPVGRTTLAAEKAGVANNLGSGTNANNRRTLGGLAGDPLQSRGVVIAAPLLAGAGAVALQRKQ